MLLYHGTSESTAKLALREGLKPRGSRIGNWQHTVESREDAVYLTDIYGGYFGFCATDTGEKAAILEVDVDRLDEARLIPDEDYLEQATSGGEGKNFAPIGMSARERTKYYREISDMNAHLAMKSLEGLGTVAYRGVIPPEAITRVCYIAPCPMLYEAAEPVICLVNHKLCKGRYEALTKWFFGDGVSPEDFDPMLSAENAKQLEGFEWMEGRREHIEKLLADRSAVTVEVRGGGGVSDRGRWVGADYTGGP